jgi:putative transposase
LTSANLKNPQRVVFFNTHRPVARYLRTSTSRAGCTGLQAGEAERSSVMMKYVGCERYRGVRKRAELLWDKARQRWCLKYAIEVADKVIHGSNRGAAIDLGVRVAASLSIEGVGQARHFAAREMLKDWDYWGRRIAQHMQELAGRGRKCSLKLSQLYAMRTARWRHAWQATSSRSRPAS